MVLNWKTILQFWRNQIVVGYQLVVKMKLASEINVLPVAVLPSQVAHTKFLKTKKLMYKELC